MLTSVMALTPVISLKFSLSSRWIPSFMVRMLIGQSMQAPSILTWAMPFSSTCIISTSPPSM